ncbi:MAG: 4-phosphoerythronate dehydrogenase [Bacteroidota bacterium]|nr:4-phosphoerythronate dehydrogenase [Bacteroidota bacterium]MDP4191281.1 4-phosphoerythronate dehydrogenase [Bacteroidota bacterium]MDP4195626.1 4-phosphoerythronate dehydrogenase [Bacteroidota bacterium]
MFKLVVDENISYAAEAFSKFGQVKLMHGRKIDRQALSDADALIIRSITNVNEELLKGTPVKFVGTATIGTDHIDKGYLRENGIAFSSAKGCNADAVAEYVYSAMFHIMGKKGLTLKDKTLGVVGIGNIGSRVVRLGKVLGLNVLENDPPLERKTKEKGFVELKEVLSADIITFHVPLNLGGEDNTYHLLDKEKLSLIKKDAILINASRGPVIDNEALLELKKKNDYISVALDVWEKEPGFDQRLLKTIEIGTPHIAGYSLEGKVNGTEMIFKALSSYLKSGLSFNPELPIVPDQQITLKANASKESILNKAFSYAYEISQDDVQMRKALEMTEEEKAKYFDLLRKDYKLRREFSNYLIRLEPFSQDTGDILRAFRFKLNQTN